MALGVETCGLSKYVAEELVTRYCLHLLLSICILAARMKGYMSIRNTINNVAMYIPCGIDELLNFKHHFSTALPNFGSSFTLTTVWL